MASSRHATYAFGSRLIGKFRGAPLVQHKSGLPDEPSGIELRTASVRRGRRVVVDDVTGRFEPGSLTAVVGPNGAGKSTLLDLLAGLVRPLRGDVLCPALTRNRVAYLPQQARMDRDYPVTVREVVGLGAWREFGPFGIPPASHSDRVAAAIESVGVTDLAGRRIAEMSVGQMQRAFFARLSLLDAQILLLDEPFAAVDARSVEVLLAMIAHWHQERRTVIAVVHDLNQVRAHFPATLLLARRPIAWGETGSVLTDANLAKAVSFA